MAHKPDTTQVLYFSDTNADIINYKRCLFTPVSGSQTSISASAVVGDGNVLIKPWITDALGLTTLTNANWNFNLYASVDDISGTTGIAIYVYKSNTVDVETELFNFSIADVNSLTPSLQLGTYNPGVITILPSDRLVIKPYIFTDSVSARTITLYILGASNQSRLITPFDIGVTGDMQKVIYNPSGDGIIAGGVSGSSGIFTSGSVTDGNLVVYYGASGSLVKDGGPVPTSGSGGTTYTGSALILVSGSKISHIASAIISGSYNAVDVDNYGHITGGSVIATGSSSGLVAISGSSIMSDSAGSIIKHNISAVTSGSYLAANIVVDSFGHVTSAANGSSGSGGITGFQKLTSASIINWNLSFGSGCVVLTENSTINNPSNMGAGAHYFLIVGQDGTGAHTLNYGTSYKFSNGAKPILSTMPYDEDLLPFDCDGNYMLNTGLYKNITNQFSPMAISGLSLWLRSDTINGLNNNDPIPSWADSSGNGYAATQSDSAHRPLYKTNIINSLPVVYFDGADDGMITSLNVPSASNFTIFVVYASTITGEFLGRTIQGSNNWFVGPYSGSQAMYNQNFIYGPAVTTNFVYATVLSSSGGASFRVSGSLIDSNADTTGPGTFGLASEGAFPGDLFTGYIAEVLVYTTLLNNDNVLLVEDYIATKYNL